MKKEVKIAIAVIVIIAIIAIIATVIIMNSKPKTKLEPINSSDDLVALIDKVYEGQQESLPMLATQIVDVTDKYFVNMVTGLPNGDNFEYLVVSEPMMSSQAYSFVLAKVKSGVDANKVANEISEKINPAKWICVSAEKIYATNSSDVICIVMSSEEWAKPVYEKFKNLAGYVEKEYEKTVQEPSIEDLEGLAY